MRSSNDGELFRLEWGMVLQVSNIIFPDEIPMSDVNIPKSRIKYVLLDAKEVGHSSNSMLDHA